MSKTMEKKILNNWHIFVMNESWIQHIRKRNKFLRNKKKNIVQLLVKTLQLLKRIDLIELFKISISAVT